MHIVTWTSKQLAHSSKNYRKTEKSRTISCTLTPKARAFLPFTHCGVYVAFADALLLWVQVMSDVGLLETMLHARKK